MRRELSATSPLEVWKAFALANAVAAQLLDGRDEEAQALLK